MKPFGNLVNILAGVLVKRIPRVLTPPGHGHGAQGTGAKAGPAEAVKGQVQVTALTCGVAGQPPAGTFPVAHWKT